MQATNERKTEPRPAEPGPDGHALNPEKHAAAGAPEPGAYRRLERAAVHLAPVSGAPGPSIASERTLMRGFVLRAGP